MCSSDLDAIVRYMINDPLKFFQTTRTELALNDRLGRIINSSVRGVIAQYELNDYYQISVTILWLKFLKMLEKIKIILV